MYGRLLAWWHSFQRWAHRYHIAFNRISHSGHLVYFSMVWLHGPYHLAAMALLLLGILGMLLHLED